MPNLEGDLVRQQEQWYVSRPDYIQRMTERSRKYLFHIVEELERRNMPTELALLPFIESAFNPQAVSSARAAGMWQFMPATGQYFELKQNVFRDDRRDVLASTRAALDYLQKLYGMFGDWHLALAAYNWGEGSVARAIARNQKAGLGTTYADLNMPNETRSYVPKLQAVKNIVANPEALRAELPLIENHPYFQSVTVSRDIDVSLAARLADVSIEDFKALNPSMNRPVILAAGTPEILLPWDNANVFQRNFEAYNARPVRELDRLERARHDERGRSGAPCRHERRRPAQRQHHPAAHAHQGRLRADRAALGQDAGRRDGAGRRQRPAQARARDRHAPRHRQGRQARHRRQRRAPLQAEPGAGRRMEQRRRIGQLQGRPAGRGLPAAAGGTGRRARSGRVGARAAGARSGSRKAATHPGTRRTGKAARRH